jgi:hypothetical protein
MLISRMFMGFGCFAVLCFTSRNAVVHGRIPTSKYRRRLSLPKPTSVPCILSRFPHTLRLNPLLHLCPGRRPQTPDCRRYGCYRALEWNRAYRYSLSSNLPASWVRSSHSCSNRWPFSKPKSPDVADRRKSSLSISRICSQIAILRFSSSDNCISRSQSGRCHLDGKCVLYRRKSGGESIQPQ